MSNIKEAIDKCSMDRIEDVEIYKLGEGVKLTYFTNIEGKPIIPVSPAIQILVKKIKDLELKILELEEKIIKEGM